MAGENVSVITDGLEANWQIYNWSMYQHYLRSKFFTKEFSVAAQKIKSWVIILSFLVFFLWTNLTHPPLKWRSFNKLLTKDTPIHTPPRTSTCLHPFQSHPTVRQGIQLAVQRKLIPIPKSDLCPSVAKAWIWGLPFFKLLPTSMLNTAFAEILTPVNDLSLLPCCLTVVSLPCHMWLRLLSAVQPPSLQRLQGLRMEKAAAEMRESWGTVNPLQMWAGEGSSQLSTHSQICLSISQLLREGGRRALFVSFLFFVSGRSGLTVLLADSQVGVPR